MVKRREKKENVNYATERENRTPLTYSNYKGK